jgi:hypothetical protein
MYMTRTRQSYGTWPYQCLLRIVCYIFFFLINYSMLHIEITILNSYYFICANCYIKKCILLSFVEQNQKNSFHLQIVTLRIVFCLLMLNRITRIVSFGLQENHSVMENYRRRTSSHHVRTHT